ncbi:MAG: DinB family protein [Acidimicrobiales bacterium]|nr:DinB family protein [Acidimicrobiales bacterium]
MEKIEPDLVGDERTLTNQFLDYQRAQIIYKSKGLDPEQVRASLPTSDISVGGMLKHLALVEDYWFDVIFSGRPERAPWNTVDWDSDPDWEWRTGADDPLDELLDSYRDAIARSTATVAKASSLDRLSAVPDSHGRQPSLRWILLHMIEETARHAGHLDLLRESIDGLVGE